MPRRPRAYLPGYAYHVYQRGNNRAPCFIERQNYLLYLKLWREISAQHNVAVHAYCLMTNHIHFLVTPSCKNGISNTMRSVGSRYAQTMNRHYDLTGTLWEGRHRSSLIDTSQYFFTCMKYIELNPVRAKMVRNPANYEWSSHRSNAFGPMGWIKPHPELMTLGSTKSERLKNYRNLFLDEIGNKDLQLIRTATHYSQPLAQEKFRRKVEEQLGLAPAYMKRGRPKRETVIEV